MPSTGLVYWQLNKGWPTLLRDLYNHDFGKAGSYFGAKKANEPLHVLYACDTGAVDWAKTMGNPQATMTQFGDLGQLQDLSPASVCTSARTPTPRQDPTEQTLSPA